MVNAIIIDDEKNALDVLYAQIHNYCPEVKVIEKCNDAEKAIELITMLKPDLVFLDIEMPRVNGFEVLDRTRTMNYKVIFTTAYDQFAIKAFRYSAIDYLLKPIDIEELRTAVKKAVNASHYNLEEKIKQLFTQINAPHHKNDRIALPFNDGYEMVPYQKIIRCESESNYTIIYLSDQRKVTLSKTLKEVEDALPQPPFFRIHHSHLINTDCISKFYKGDGGYVMLTDGSQISISRARKEEFINYINKI